MKIVTWNCQGAFRKKSQHIAPFLPDIAIIQECECPEKLRFAANIRQPTDFVWLGDHPSKGVGVFSYSDARFQIDPCYDPSIKHCIPIQVSGAFDLHLLAVWAMGHKQKALSYVGQVYRAVHTYRDFIQAKPTIIAGDWNSNAIWDGERTASNHSNLMKQLTEAGLVSVYHDCHNEPQGQESQMTFWWYRHEHRGFHLDYCCVPQTWMPQLQSFTIGSYAEWHKLSDHSPLFLEFQTGVTT